MLTQAALAELDRDDTLAPMRARFRLPAGIVYLDGNSLGPMPADAPARLDATLRQWRDGLIRSWNDAGWIDQPARLGARIATLIGAAAGTVLVCDSTTLNIVKAVGAALALRPGRTEVLTETDGFPTDAYAAQSLLALLGGHRLRAVAPEAVADAIGADTACVLLSHVDYRSGRLRDLGGLTAHAHERGALAVWDLAHSAGAMPIGLDASGADFAVGCGYKFLNGGPGAPAFLYAAPRWLDSLRFPLAGWLGHAAPFAFEPIHRPAPGIAAAQLGTPPILGMAALDAGLDAALAAPLDAVRAKSVRLGDVFIALVEQRCAGLDLTLLSPRDGARRGSHVSFTHAQAWPVMQALIARGVIGDVRQPDILRFGLTPLTLSYAELGIAVDALADILRHDVWREPAYQARRTVT